MNKKNKHAKALAHAFYMDVFTYINMEYRPKYAKLFANSSISEKLVELINQYYWGGNSVPFVAGQVVDLIKSKYGV